MNALVYPAFWTYFHNLYKNIRFIILFFLANSVENGHYHLDKRVGGSDR